MLTVSVFPETTDNPVTVPAFPEIFVWSPVFDPETEAPEEILEDMTAPATVNAPADVILLEEEKN